ncbi:hypothetical protein J3Q64DRAFT_1746171 [Phycomyces blakesleeanus]|uniref:RING-type domain-containing protein n=1 Tax=Phycomyces blakesleeanus TaxID=4837 RepID=A0ABR3AYL8_PHYBL
MQESNVDLRSLNYSEPNPNLICCVCQTPFIDPVISPCGHTFCQSCIYQAIETSPHCPIDRAPLEISNLIPAVKIITNMVNELIVQCPRLEAGCDFEGQRQFIQNHLDHDCLYSSTACQMEECKELFYKKDLDCHTATCQYRTIECLMCKKMLRAIQLQEHHDVCPAELIQCSHCSTSHTRSEYTKHINTCPLHPATCTHTQFGCTWAGKRHEQDDHAQTCAYEAIKHFLFKQQHTERSLRHDLDQLQQENQRLRNQQDYLREHVQLTVDQLSLFFPSHFPSQISTLATDNTYTHTATTDTTTPTVANNSTTSTTSTSISSISSSPYSYLQNGLPNSSSSSSSSSAVPTSSSTLQNPIRPILLADSERLETELETLNANLISLELKQNMALMTETFRLQEEMQSLRAVCHGIRMQMHYVMMERRESMMANASSTVANTNASANTSSSTTVAGTNSTPGALPALQRMRQWLGKL